MTVDTEHLASRHRDLTPMCPSCSAAWLAVPGMAPYAPMERHALGDLPFVWSAAEIFHAPHLNWTAPGLVTFAASCIASARPPRRPPAASTWSLTGPRWPALWAVPGAWPPRPTLGPFPLVTATLAMPWSAPWTFSPGDLRFGPVWLSPP